jgi:pimeloyl-ACP methyl ester carboxylesterase
MIQTTKVAHRTIKARDLDIFYREAGPKDAPAVLLLHGFPTSSQMFRNLIPALADRYRVLAVPQPTDVNASLTRRWASGVSGTRDFPTNPGTSSGLIPRIRRAAWLALMNRDSMSSLT